MTKTFLNYDPTWWRLYSLSASLSLSYHIHNHPTWLRSYSLFWFLSFSYFFLLFLFSKYLNFWQKLFKTMIPPGGGYIHYHYHYHYHIIFIIIPPGGDHIHYFVLCHFHISLSFFCQKILVSDHIFFKLWSCMVEVILIISIIMRRCILIIMVRIRVIIKIIKIISTNRILIRMMVPGKKLLQSLNNDIKAQQ